MNAFETIKTNRGFTDRQMAELFGVSVEFIRKLRSGHRRPSPDMAARISAATGGEVTIEELLYPDGVPPESRMAENS
jgi:transcriptional regulator with XRE-family HTH domain